MKLGFNLTVERCGRFGVVTDDEAGEVRLTDKLDGPPEAVWVWKRDPDCGNTGIFSSFGADDFVDGLEGEDLSDFEDLTSAVGFLIHSMGAEIIPGPPPGADESQNFLNRGDT